LVITFGALQISAENTCATGNNGKNCNTKNQYT